MTESSTKSLAVDLPEKPLRTCEMLHQCVCDPDSPVCFVRDRILQFNSIVCVRQGGTMLGPPDTVVELGETEVSEEIFMDYLASLGESAYRLISCVVSAPSLIPPSLMNVSGI